MRRRATSSGRRRGSGSAPGRRAGIGSGQAGEPRRLAGGPGEGAPHRRQSRARFRYTPGVDPIEAIPHRPPVLCVDRLVEADREHAVAEGVARAAEPWLVEGLAQTAALMNAKAYGESGLGMLVQVRRFEIVRAPREGEVLEFRVDLVRRLAPLSLMDGRVHGADGEPIASGELKFYLESES